MERSPGLDILVVDDDARNLVAIEAALGDLASHLVEARSGTEALRRLLERDFALVLLDVRMPGLGGFETARLIREREKSRHIPIIFVTAYPQEDADVLRGYALGAVDFLSKPIVPDVLRAKAQVFVDLRARTEELRVQAERLRELERQNFEQKIRQEREEWRAAALRREMDEQRRINAQLEEADRQKNEFLAMLGHELRNPLVPVVNALELWKRETSTDPRLERAREAAVRQCRHLVRLVDDLLDVSRIERGKIDLQRVPTDVRDIARLAIDTVRPHVDQRGHRLTASLGAAPVYVHGDPVRLAQVVGNLLHNAARYTDPGGTIDLRVDRRGADVVIRVEDDGRGIDPDLLPRVFDVFVQAHERAGGLGLGLTLVKRLVEAHGGSVEARSAGPGCGSAFEVRLPMHEVEAQGAPAPRAARPAVRSMSVVVVEDDDDIRETTQALLEAFGHRAETAPDGRSGVELVCRTRPELALVDLGLPDLDGLEVARRIRAQLGASAPHLVAVTGYGQEEDRERCREAGFDAHLVKPASPDLLVQTIERAARRSAGAS